MSAQAYIPLRPPIAAPMPIIRHCKCGVELVGRQRKYCGDTCRHRYLTLDWQAANRAHLTRYRQARHQRLKRNLPMACATAIRELMALGVSAASERVA